MTAPTCCPILELRQYTLRPHRRDDLIALFEREFIEPQEACGNRLIGQFRDLDDPDRFVWLRGFEDMASRRDALAAFYGGPVWKAHREEANATMVDSDNVLLLRPLTPDSGFRGVPKRTAQAIDAPRREAPLTASIYDVERPVIQAFAAFFADVIEPAARDAGLTVEGVFVTAFEENTFPALPVRDASVFVWFARGELARPLAIDRSGASPEVLRQLARKPEALRLAPTPRSLLR